MEPLRAFGATVDDHLGEQLPDVHVRLAKRECSALQLGKVEQAHDELQELLALLVDGLDELFLIAGQRACDALGRASRCSR